MTIWTLNNILPKLNYKNHFEEKQETFKTNKKINEKQSGFNCISTTGIKLNFFIKNADEDFVFAVEI